VIEPTGEMVQLIYERIDFVNHGNDGIREGLVDVFALVERDRAARVEPTVTDPEQVTFTQVRAALAALGISGDAGHVMSVVIEHGRVVVTRTHRNADGHAFVAPDGGMAATITNIPVRYAGPTAPTRVEESPQGYAVTHPGQCGAAGPDSLSCERPSTHRGDTYVDDLHGAYTDESGELVRW
jgi:hypothetical protein